MRMQIIISIFFMALLNISCSKVEKKQPNILIIYADDMGYGDLNIQNPDSKFPTPNLDQLSKEGMRFTDAHSSSGVCTPSRYALLTGRYHWRQGEGIVGSWEGPWFDKGRFTLPAMLREKGYRTACIGKWHLGWEWGAIRNAEVEDKNHPDAHDWSKPVPGGPLDHGFDYYFGDDVPNFPPYTWIENDRILQPPTVAFTPIPSPTNALDGADRGEGHDTRPGPMVEGWRLDEVMPRLTGKTVEWIGQQSTDQPFFLYWSWTAPHTPVVPTEEYQGTTEAGPYGDFMHQIDAHLGQVLQALADNGLADNTLVIFTSDNGPESIAYPRIQSHGHYSMGSLRGVKQDVWEGGHRVPFIVRWPGVVEANTVSHELVSQIDVMGTIASLVGYELPDNAAEDSHDLLPLLRGEAAQSGRETLVHRTWRKPWGIRHGEWVYINAPTGSVQTEPEWRGYPPNPYEDWLNNIREDLGQEKNLVGEYPERAESLRTKLNAIRESASTAPRLDPKANNQIHPRILVNDGDKQIVLSKIENQEWAKKLYGDLLEKIEPIADRHIKQPDWILSRYQMYRIPGKYYTDFYTDSDGTALIEMEGNAPVPTIRGNTHKRPALDPDGFRFRSPRLEEFPVNDTMYEMFLQSTAPSGDWYWTDPQRVVGHINGTINKICLESAIIYWLTGDEKYAKLASDIIVQWVNGAYYQNPYQGACRDGFFAVQSLDDLAYSTLPIAFDFLYGYLKRNEAPLDKFDAVFERLTQTQLERGFWNNNWFAAQSPTYVYSALAISDKEKRDKYLHYFMYEDHIHGICGRLSLKTTCERWLTPDGHWKEPGGYHNFPVGNILQASVAAEKNGYKVLTEFPPLYKASYVMMRYLFPNKKVMAFGDTGRGTMNPKHLEIAIAMAIKYNDPVLPTLVTAIEQMIDDGYKREDAGWFGLLNNIGALPATESSEIELPRTGTLDFAKCFYQRNGVDQTNGMMCYVQGATYNHNHCNGIAMELYGQGLVLGNDPGIGGHYDTQIHKEYYALFAAHNTVIAAGKSGPLEPFRGSGGSKPMGASELNVMEPLPDHTAVSPYCSFTSVDYLEPSTHTNQKRTLALIRTSERTGYYVDIFHSDNKEKNEYLYHNLGNSLKLFDTENNLIPMFATTELSEHVDGYGPGYKHFDKKLTTKIYGNDVKAHFRLDVEDKKDIFMDMHIAGGADREYFTAMAPKSYTAPSEYKLLPNPVAVVRQNGDAWKNPFMVVYESYTGEKNSSITNVSGDSNGETSVLKVESEFGIQTIIQSFSKKAYQNEADFFAGHFGVISYGDKGLSYLYLGDGTKISSGEYSIEARDNMRMNANMELKNDRIIISSNQQAIVYLPFGNKENIVFEVNGEKIEVNAQKTGDNLWKIEIPPVMNAVIYK